MSYTVVTALLNINRDKWETWHKRKWEDYIEAFKRGVLKIQAPMFIFCDPSLEEIIKEARSNQNYPTTLAKCVNLSDYKLYEHKDRIREIQQSEDYKNLLRMGNIEKCPEVYVPEYDVVVNNKLEFMYQISLANPFSTDYFVWIDAGFGHAKINLPNNYRWDNKDILELCAEDKMVCFTLINKMSSTDPVQFFKDHQDYIAGGIFCGNTKAITELHSVYYDLIKANMEKGIIDDDQYNMAMASVAKPELFEFVCVHGWNNFNKVLTGL